MGTWHIDKDRLKKTLTKPIRNCEAHNLLSNGLGDDEFLDFLDELRMKNSPNKIVNDEVIKWLTKPDWNDEVWLVQSDVDEITNNKVTDKYGKPDTSPSLLENIANHIDKKIEGETT